jgi:glucose-1-phosphate thymidylyltransferase
MKAVILSGGSGQRLLPLTSKTTKQLLPIANKPTLFHILDRIKEETEIKSVVVVVSQDFGHQVKETLLNSEYSKYFSMDFVFQDQPLGLAHAVQITKGQVGDDSFLMFLGDILIEKGEVKKAVEKFSKDNFETTVFLNEVEDPRPYGVAEVDGERVLKLIEKPENPKSNLCLSGIYLFKPSIFFAIENIKPSFRGELEITDAVDFQIQKGKKVGYYKINGLWFDVGTPENMLLANQFLLSKIENEIESEVNDSVKIKGLVQIGKNVIIENSEITGPVIIADNTIIKDSKIGPNVSLASNIVIESSNIENSIIRDNSKIKNIEVTISDSIMGENVEINRTLKGKGDYILGDGIKCMSS